MPFVKSSVFILWLTVATSFSHLECELYIAESTIPNAGLGIFTTVEKSRGDTVGNGDLPFPLLELEWHNKQRPHDKTRRYVDPFEDYVWDGTTMGMGKEVDDGHVTTVWPGLDCIVNCLLPLQNLRRTFPKHLSHGDNLPYMPHRANDPGAGAITTYRSGSTTVTKYIPPGGELFKSYGEEWFTSRPHHFPIGFPLKKNFPLAEKLIDTCHDRFDFQPLYELLLDVRTIWKESRTLNALPSTMEQLQVVLEHNLTYIYQQNATRDLNWLQQHGTCVDHIVHGPSTIPGAGEGAFAKRNLPKGTIITGTPLMIIPFEDFLDMYNEELEEGDDDPQHSPFTKQVIYNYCFGHEESTLLLFPYAAVGVHYINHNPHLANVKIQWADHGTLRHNASILELTPDEIHSSVHSPSLGIEYIALTDIAEGEELFLDYGDAWDAAWKHHVENWKPPTENTISADWNQKYIRTMEEELIHPYPQNIELRCHALLLDDDWEDKESGWKRYGNFRHNYEDVYGLPCTVLERNSDKNTYVVEISTDHLLYRAIPEEMEEEGNFTRHGVPREALFFLDATFKSDLYLESTFRHPISIPDYMMPLPWRNRGMGTGRGVPHDEL